MRRFFDLVLRSCAFTCRVLQHNSTPQSYSTTRSIRINLPVVVQKDIKAGAQQSLMHVAPLVRKHSLIRPQGVLSKLQLAEPKKEFVLETPSRGNSNGNEMYPTIRGFLNE